MRERMDHTDSTVVQVLKYSQSDWNKMKQDLDLDFQDKLLNKEREWSKELADKEKSISRLSNYNKDMESIMTEYEKAMCQLNDETTNDSEFFMAERDQAIDHIEVVEIAFSDLHRRYEETKSVVEGFEKNEEALKKCLEDYQTKFKKYEDKLQTIKQQAEEKLEVASVEMDKLKRRTTANKARLDATIRKSDLLVANLHKSLDQKVKENEELIAICDELIAKIATI